MFFLRRGRPTPRSLMLCVRADFFATVESMMSWCSGKEPIVPVYDVKPEHVKPLTELFQPRRDSSPRKFTDEAHSDQPAMTSTVVPSPGRESMVRITQWYRFWLGLKCWSVSRGRQPAARVPSYFHWHAEAPSFTVLL